MSLAAHRRNRRRAAFAVQPQLHSDRRRHLRLSRNQSHCGQEKTEGPRASGLLPCGKLTLGNSPLASAATQSVARTPTRVMPAARLFARSTAKNEGFWCAGYAPLGSPTLHAAETPPAARRSDANRTSGNPLPCASAPPAPATPPRAATPGPRAAATLRSTSPRPSAAFLLQPYAASLGVSVAFSSLGAWPWWPGLCMTGKLPQLWGVH